MKTLLMIGLLCLTNTLAYAADDVIDALSWKLKKDTDGIQIYSAKVPDSRYRAVLAETLVNINTHQLVNILRSPEICAQWVYRCDHSYLYKKVSQDTDLVYTTTNMPFPAKDRDILAKIIWQSDPNTQIVRVIGTATKYQLIPIGNQIRIKKAQMIWELTPIGNDKTKIRNYAHINPAGGLPAWLINQLAIDAPLKTLQGLKTLISEISTAS